MVVKGDHVCGVVLGILLTTFMSGCSCQVLPILYRSMNWVDSVDCNGCQGDHVCGVVLGILLITFIKGCSCQVLSTLYLCWIDLAVLVFVIMTVITKGMVMLVGHFRVFSYIFDSHTKWHDCAVYWWFWNSASNTQERVHMQLLDPLPLNAHIQQRNKHLWSDIVVSLSLGLSCVHMLQGKH